MGLLASSVMAAGIVGIAGPASATTVSPEESCAQLESVDLADVTRIEAELVTDGRVVDETGVSGGGREGLPEFCRVQLTVEPEIDIEVWLPTDTYNGRVQSVGGGGYAGRFGYAGMAAALGNGYVTSGTDTGHFGNSGSFALDTQGNLNWQLIEDFAYRGIFEQTEKTFALTEAFYEQDPEYTYWNGCSTGGRQGQMLAQRMPDAYDGIMSGAPAINWDRFLTAELWPQVVMNQDLGGPIAPCKLDLATEAAITACDALDGVEDGVLENPRDCDFDPATLVGTATDCGVVTAAEAEAIGKIWQGPRTTDGEFLWYGLEPSTRLHDSLDYALASTSPFRYAVEHHAYWIEQNPGWNWRMLDYEGFEENFRTAVELYNEVIGTDDADLTAFRDAGGKTLIWHGWIDEVIFPRGTIDYYERIEEEVDGQVTDFARLFMAPGVEHCGGGTGPEPVDPFGALVDWVENGDAPEQLDAALTRDGDVVRTRPLCLYPAVAVWTGSGSTDVAENFECQGGEDPDPEPTDPPTDPTDPTTDPPDPAEPRDPGTDPTDRGTDRSGNGPTDAGGRSGGDLATTGVSGIGLAAMLTALLVLTGSAALLVRRAHRR